MIELQSSPVPRLRHLDVRPINQQGQPCLVLSDPLQLTDKQLVIPQTLAPALAYCDGQTSVDDVCKLFQSRTGIPLLPEQLNQMLATLDDAYMLDNERFQMLQSETKRLFRRAACRQPSLAGRAYPSDPGKLRTLFDSYLADVPDVFNAVGSSGENASISAPQNGSAAPIRGLLSPHIDYQRGGAVYAQVWKRAAAAAQAADLVIIFGTDHNGSDPVTLTQQNYATPYGILPTERNIVDELAGTITKIVEHPAHEDWRKTWGNTDAFAGELRHRGEHSLELVLTWLHHMRNGKPCQVVPILVGGFHAHIRYQQSPEENPLLRNILERLTTISNEHAARGKNVLVVASGDLAHVGPAFGGKALNKRLRKQLTADDQRLIQAMTAGNQHDFFEEIRYVKDTNNVCGVSPIYLTMSLLERLGKPPKGELTGYESCVADETHTSAVTVGGVLFR